MPKATAARIGEQPETERALYDLARTAGKNGETFGEWSQSDEAQALIETVERLDSDAVEAAFNEGRREYRATAWKPVWTTAPEGYDSGGTETVETGGDFHGKTIRRVLVEPRNFEWQTRRYGSGLHGSWDADPRLEEAGVRESIDRERLRREEDAARRTAGLAWLATAPLAEIEDSDENWEAWQARGLRTEDARAERKRRAAEEDVRSKAAEWARCAALIPDGAALVDEGAKGFRGTYGWIAGQPADAWTSVRIVPGWPADDPEEAKVVGEGGVVVGSLTFVARWITEGRARIATPEEAAKIPPPAVMKRLGHREWKEIRWADVEGRRVWVGRARFGESMVLDADGHLVRSKKIREIALRGA